MPKQPRNTIESSSTDSDSTSDSGSESESAQIKTLPASSKTNTPSRARRKQLETQKDMFSNVNEVMNICFLLEEEAVRAEENEDNLEDERLVRARNKVLKKVDDNTRKHCQCVYDYIMDHAPYLANLIGKKKKRHELQVLISDPQIWTRRPLSHLFPTRKGVKREWVSTTQSWLGSSVL
ncbi:hypothetical protein SERLADRAFT_411638 [Serpula lacrymans var. lacrymans S7.9]|uniref:Uncharacterized protein n=1 Tax=Serpula lacrymans var. lacrymans (strain S7.9) TaxID=578457 RepID=F8PBJ8_SERL9|nr:uncharacterized protein SERLADRAFT_411638 [Serpula lacrymans var. lacrymans S7.9]EGO19636.1 hypothetical protein SERLADRAFT_411638 [Serpula lacrymans var. lacrymans S7.9]